MEAGTPWAAQTCAATAAYRSASTVANSDRSAGGSGTTGGSLVDGRIRITACAHWSIRVCAPTVTGSNSTTVGAEPPASASRPARAPARDALAQNPRTPLTAAATSAPRRNHTSNCALDRPAELGQLFSSLAHTAYSAGSAGARSPKLAWARTFASVKSTLSTAPGPDP